MTPQLIYGVAGILLGCIVTGLVGAACARIFTQGLRQELSARLQDHEQSLCRALTEREAVPSLTPDFDEARITQRVQQAVQVEIEYLARLQSDRDEALAQTQGRWHAEQEARHARDMRALLEALEAQSKKTVARAAATRQNASPRTAPDSFESPPAAVSARPPELMHVPLPRPEIAPEPEQPELELSDEEIDALPPELPSAKPRKRTLPAPTKPPLRSI